MTTKIKFKVALFISTIFFYGCSTLNVPIDKNKLITNCTIDFEGKNIQIKQNSTFSLNELGLIANTSAGTGARVSFLQDVTKTIKMFKQNRFINYDITIKNPKYAQVYYGKIAFFNISKKNAESAVAKYREIGIDDSYFANSSRGRTALLYEFVSHYQMGISELKTPTWVLIMSDEPF